MYAFALLFLKVIFASLLNDTEKEQYVAGLVILGAAPCTAMVFVWSSLLNGNATATLFQVPFSNRLLPYILK
jgi:ACR3 family arsenite transporter